jgi:hypothetical protein
MRRTGSRWFCPALVGQQWRGLHAEYGSGRACRWLRQANGSPFHYDGAPAGIKEPVVIAVSGSVPSTSSLPIRKRPRGGGSTS